MRCIGFFCLSAFLILFGRADADRNYVENQAGLRTELLAQYNKNIKPSHQVNVSVDMFVRTIQKLDIKEGAMELQVTFRQKWYDSRLVFDGKRKYSDVKFLTINNIDGNKLIWVPDTFFRNELESNVHHNLVPNEYLRVFPDGHVLYSSRISLKTVCFMDFKHFPFDKQTCSLQLASYGFTTQDIQYIWKVEAPIQITKVLNLKEYYLDFMSYRNPMSTDTCDVTTSTGRYSCLKVDFAFRRDGSFITLTILIPILMFVCLSFLSLFISPKLLGCRLALSFGSLIAASAIAFAINVYFGIAVAYTKSIDIYTGISIFFIFFTVATSVLLEVFAKDEDLQEKGGLVSTFKTGSNIARFNLAARLLCPILYFLFVVIFFASA